MIFKTFNSDIDKISSKWGIFGHSFNDIGTAIVGRITDINKAFQATGDLVGSIKDSESIWKRLYPSKESIKEQLIDVDNLIPKIDKENFDFDHWINELNNVDKQVKAGTKSWQDYSNGLNDNQKWIAKWGQETEGQIRTQSDIVKANQQARSSALAHNEALKQQTLGAKASKLALSALATVGNMFAGIAISWVISKAFEGIDYLVNYEKKQQEALENAKSNVEKYSSAIKDLKKEQEDLAKSTDDIANRYAQLSQKINNETNINEGLSTDEYQEFLDLNSQLAELFPQLTRGYDENGQAILGLGGGIDTVTEKIKALVEQQERLAKQEAIKSLESYVDGDDSGGGQLEVIKKNVDKIADLNKELKEYEKDFNSVLDGEEGPVLNNSSWQSIDKYEQKLKNIFGLTDKMIEKVRKRTNNSTWYEFDELSKKDIEYLTNSNKVYNNKLNEYQEKIQAAKDELKLVNQDMSSHMSIWLQSLSAYTDSDEGIQKALDNMLNSVDWSKIDINSFEEAKNYILTNIIGSLDNVPDSDKKAFSKALSNLYSVDTSDLSLKETREVMNNYIEQVMGYLGLDYEDEDAVKDFKLKFGITVYTNKNTKTNRKALIESLKDSGINEKDAKNIVDGLTETETNYAVGMDINIIAQASVNGLEDVKQTINNEMASANGNSLTFTELLSGSIGIETIDDYTEKINTLQSYLDKFKDGSYSPADKLSLATDFGITGDSVEDITNQIQKLMDTEMDTIIAKIDEILNTKNLNETTRKELENLKQTLEDVAKEAQNTASFPLTGNVLADVQKLTEGLDQLDQIYADVYDKEDFDWSSILNNEAFSKTFGEYTEEYNNFLDTISKSPDDITACQEAFNQLAGAYIYGSGVLNEVTESTKDATIQMLEQMGVANAQEIVMKALAAQEAFLAAKKKDSSIQSENLAEATWQEIQAVLAEGEAAEETQTYLAQLALSKLDITNNPINTDEDVKAIIAIATAAGTSQGYVAALQTALENLVKAQEDVKKIQNTEVSGSFADAAKGAALGGAKVLETSAKETAAKYLAEIEGYIDKNKLNANDFLADYKGGSATKSAIEKAEKEKEKEKKDAEKSKSEKQIDFFEYRLKELDQAIDTVETHMNNFTGSAAKNLAIDTLIQIDAGKQSDLHKSLSLYTHMAEEELAKIPEQFQEMAKNGAINITDFIETADDENGTIAEAIENYRKWADKVDEVSLSIEELNTTMRQLELDKFKNIAADYTKLLDQITQSTSRLETLMDTQEKISGTKSRAYYEELMGKTQIQLDYLQKEKSALEQQIQNAVTSGIQVGSDEWAEMKSSLADIDSQIIQCVGSMEDFADSIREIDVSNFEKVMSSFDRIETEIDRLLSLSENDVVVDDKGNLTQSALTQIGLLGEKYTIALRKAEEYKKGLESLDQAYAAGKLNFTEYLELHNQLNDGLTDSLQAQKDAKDAVFKFKQQVIDKEIENINKARDAYKEYIDAKKEALDRESDSYDFNKEMADLRKELTSLDTQIGQLTGDDDYTLAKKAELQQQRKDKQEELDEKLYKRSIDQQKEALDKQYEDYSADCDRRIEIAEKSAEQITENIEREFNNLMQEVSQNADQCLAGINQLCSKYGIKVSENLTEPWKEGEHALGIYHGKLDTHTGAFNSMLDDVKQHIYDDGREADNTAQKLIDTFGLRADTLNHELSLVWDGLNSDRERSAALSDSLWNTFNTHSSAPLVGQLNNAETAARNTAGAVGSIEGAAQRSSGAVNQIAREAGGVRDTIDDASQSAYELGENFKSAADTASRALDQLIQIGVSIPANMAKATTRMLQETSNAIQNATNAVINTGINAMMSGTANRNSLAAGLAMLGGGSGFAEGGVITKKDDYLTPLAKSKGEDTAIFVKYGERVLTKEENQEFEAYEAAKEEITPTLNKATSVQTVDDLPVIDLVKYKEVFLKEHPNYYMEHLNINLDNLTGGKAIQNIDSRNIDNSINFNGALIEVKGDIHRDDMKTMENVAKKEIKRALDKQFSAARPYLGI